MDDAGEKKLTPGAIAMLIAIPVTLLLFAIDAVVLIRGADADRAAHARPAAVSTADAAPAASAR